MDMYPRKKTIILFLISGMIGSALLASSDWLMIFGDTAFEGTLAWLTVGAARIPAWRNALAMLISFVAVVFYALALLGVRHFLRVQKHQDIYVGLTTIGMTPWMCLHLFYVMILFAFGWMFRQGHGALAYELCEEMFHHFVWLVPLSEVMMLLPFAWLFYLFVSGKSIFSKWMAINNPLLIYVVLKLLTGFLPDAPYRLAFINGLMSESMLIWFVVLLAVFCKNTKFR